jgi:lipopolysaccharide biosynthesis protein
VSELRSIAFYLPQFHPIPENDAWWGPGFTEWHKVVRGRPLFRGHEQPLLPGALGFYDLRTPDTREAQAQLAVDHRIDAFCYYHYWFKGRQLLQRPFAEVLASGSPDFPFLLCWANERWTRAWDGSSRSVLIDQEYSKADDIAHIEALLPALADPRYVRVGGRPLLLIYRAGQLPEPQRTCAIWRKRAVEVGLPEPYLCRVESLVAERGDPRDLGFDGAVQFSPDWSAFGRGRSAGSLLRYARSRLRTPRVLFRGHRVVPYDAIVEASMRDVEQGYPRWLCVTPSWDNSVRRDEHAFIVAGASAEAYGAWVRRAARVAVTAETPEPLLFVNAWNEWAEGAVLEPTENRGSSFLEAHRSAINSLNGDPQ